MVLLFIILSFANMVYGDLMGECNMVGFYTELGCTPVTSDNATKCPVAFNCPDLHPDPKSCFYRGRPYSDRDPIPQSLVNNPCSQACTCVMGSEPRFQCAAVDCVQTFNSDLQQQCIYTYELDACCYTGSVCGKDAIAKLKTCEVDGQTYKEGQLFEPKNTRKSCICTPQWNGSLEASYCRDINCGIEIHYQDKLSENCAPVFANNARSCPIAFQCATSSTKIVRSLNIQSNNLQNQCLFGDLRMSVGDEVAVDEACTKCICEVPPFVSCTRQTACDAADASPN